MKTFITITMMVAMLWARAQGVVIAESESTADPSAILDVQSTEKGVLLPRLTEQQRLLIESPVDGLIVFQSNAEEGFYFFNGNEWNRLTSSKDESSKITDSGSGEVITVSERTAINEWTSSAAREISSAGRGKVITQEELDSIYNRMSYPKYSIIKDVKSPGSYGGVFASGDWQTRTLNTVEGDNSFVTLSGGTTGIDGTATSFTLDKGTYFIEAFVPAYYISRHSARLYSITNNKVLSIGSAEYVSNSGSGVNSWSRIFTSVELETETSFEIQHKCSSSGGEAGMGTYGGSGVEEVYTTVKITKTY